MAENSTGQPIIGRTYSLYGGTPSSDGYYEEVRGLVDACLAEAPNASALLSEVRHAGTSKRRARRAPVADRVRPALLRYIPGLEDHLRNLSLRGRFDRELAMNEAQYLLGMMEIELTNRVHRDAFFAADHHIALLPHCLRDLHPQCQAAMAGIDYVCRRCTNECFIHRASDLLAHQRIKAYIWMNRNLQKILFQARSEHGTVGVLGIACIPELLHGMRRCLRLGVPVIGIPLDANRCRRWMGATLPNTVNLGELEKLLSHGKAKIG